MIPKKGQYFTVENLTSDLSYHSTVFKCAGSNDSHVVGIPVNAHLKEPVLLSPKRFEFFDAETIAAEFV